jgi:hypothetical protein
MQSTLLIEGRMFGRNRSLFPDWSMPAPPEWLTPGSPLTLRDLISGIVREEVKSFQERREQRRLIHALTETQIAEGVARGKVDMGGREEAEADADPDKAVATALLAFEDGLYYVFVDAEHRLDLGEEIRLRSESRVTFLRLVALAGG